MSTLAPVLVIERITGVWPLVLERLTDASNVPQPIPRTAPPVAVLLGPQGPPGTSVLRSAAAAVGGHRAVAFLADGQVRHANLADAVAGTIAGLTTQAGGIGDVVSVVTSGPVAHTGWAWSAGPIYLAPDGVLTQALPTTAAIFQMGFAAGPTGMIVEPRLIAAL